MRVRTAACLLVLLLVGCASHDDVRARYRLERMLWHAQFYQRRVNIAFISSSTRDMRSAMGAYRAIVEADPLAVGTPSGWNPAVVADIRELVMSARVALANLYFATERYADAGTLYKQTLQLGSLNFQDMLDVRMGAARVSYMEGDSRHVIEQCNAIFREVENSPTFWSGKGHIDDVFLNIPVALVQMHKEDGETTAADSAATTAAAFYRRVSVTWPGTRIDWQSRMAIAQLHMIREDWPAAHAALLAILDDPTQKAGDASTLELVAGEMEAFRPLDTTAGRERFERIRARYPQSPAAYAAAYDLALLREKSDPAGAMQDFRKLADLPGVPDAVAARAMLSRARILEQNGDWDEAYAVLRRVEQLYPFTAAAMEAPLIYTRHFATVGPADMLELSLTHAREYYNSLLDRNSAFPGNRSVAQAALVESFLASGRADEAAQTLSEGSQSWDDASVAAGMVKAAALYHDVLHDDERARVTLQRVIDRFPGTRFAHVARERLARLASGS